MKSDFLLAITQLSAEKNLPSEVVITAVEAALVSAYRKDNFAPNQNISVKINPASGKVQVWAEKAVVERPSDSRCEISLAEAQQIKPEAQIGEILTVEATPSNAGRIAAQTAKQVILQRLHEAEHSAILEEYAGREGALVNGLVQRVEPRQIFVDLGRTEAILPTNEQVSSEKYRVGQRAKAVILEVVQTGKGPRVILSRSHPALLRRLFEIEVPEVLNGTVELKAIAREAGSRSKVAVAANQEGVDPVGCCVGLRGIRIQNIVNELSGEKIDVLMWSPDARLFIASALSPAQILSVTLDEKNEAATVVVPDRQLSLAIGREGQNVRLAAKLTGWRIDLKSASAVEAERAEAARSLAQAEAESGAAVEEEATAEIPPVEEEIAVETAAVLEPALTQAETGEPLPPLEAAFAFPSPALEPAAARKSGLRFAEDILAPRSVKPQAKSRKRKRKGEQDRESGADEGRRTKPLRDLVVSSDEDDEL